MSKNRLRLTLTSIFIFICILSPSFALAQTPPQSPEDIPIERVNDDIPIGPVEPVKSPIKIELKDGLLSVEITDAEFGNVIKEIADKAGFKVEVSNSVANKKISAAFKNVDVERGVRRLINITREKDFTISYAPSGLMDKIEIFGGSIKQTTPTPLKKPRTTPKPAPRRSRYKGPTSELPDEPVSELPDEPPLDSL